MIAIGLLCAVLDVACVGTGAAAHSRSSAPSALGKELTAVQARGPAAVLDFVERREPLARTRRDRGELTLASARAQRDLGQPRTAMLGYRQAWSLLGPQVDGVTADLLREWADLCLASDLPGEAAEHYEQALAQAGLSTSQRDALLASLVVACEASGDAQAATHWRREIRGSAATLIAAARAAVRDPVRGAARSTGTARLVPSDPRAIQAGIHRRSEWRAAPTRGNVTAMRPVTSITLHHSAMPAPGSSVASVASHLRGIQAFHVEERGWADVGYHFLVDPSGRVWEGRSLAWQGAHAGGDNNIGNVGVCLLGDFERQRVPRAQLQAAEELIGSLRGRFGVPRSRVVTHREWNAGGTQCPGEYLQRAVSAYRSQGSLTAGF